MSSRYDKILGCLLAAAIGDAMGCPLETRTTELIRRDFGDEGEGRGVLRIDLHSRYERGKVFDELLPALLPMPVSYAADCPEKRSQRQRRQKKTQHRL